MFAHLYFLQRVWEPLGIARHRKAVARGVTGSVLEVGVGTGFSLPHYAHAPSVAIDPNAAMVRKARRKAAALGLKTSFVVADGGALPFRDDAFDTVVSQIVFCSVERPAEVAREIARVLAPEGRLRSVEHGLATQRGSIARMQRAIAPVWARLFGGCRLDRDVYPFLLEGGLDPERVRRCSGGTVVRGTYRVRP